MPLRYKKLILIFTLAIMLIGLGTFSLLAPEVRLSLSGSKDQKTAAELALEGKTDKQIEEEIAQLIKDYFSAKLKVDMSALGELVSDVSHIDEKKLVAEAEYIESYANIKCTLLKGEEPASYRAYVYHEDKYFEINSSIPSLTGLYIKADKHGEFVVYNGSLSAKEQKNIEELDKSKDVLELRKSVDEQLQALIKSDQQVAEFYQMLENSSDDGEESTENIHQEAGSAAGTTPAAAAAPSN